MRTMIDVCRKRGLHPRADCEDTEKVEARHLRHLQSDLFKTQGCVPSAQKEIMNRNACASQFFRLPPEIRLRIYQLVFGGQHIWIGYDASTYEIPKSLVSPQHRGGGLYHRNTVDGSGRGLDLRLLRVCRHVFTETALLPYALNKFSFQSEDVRKAFERVTRPGKKLAQKKAIGKYEIMDLLEYKSQMLGISEIYGRWQDLGVGGWEIRWRQIQEVLAASAHI